MRVSPVNVFETESSLLDGVVHVMVATPEIGDCGSRIISAFVIACRSGPPMRSKYALLRS